MKVGKIVYGDNLQEDCCSLSCVWLSLLSTSLCSKSTLLTEMWRNVYDSCALNWRS